MKFVARDQLSEEQLEEALQACANEPIHIPASIQPFGVMIVVSAADMVIVQVSENVEQWFVQSAEQLVGQKITAILGPQRSEFIEEIAQTRELQPIRSTVMSVGKNEFDVVAHLQGKSLIIEFELITDPRSLDHDFFYNEIRQFTIGIRESETVDQLYQHVVDQVRSLTEFDRVKLYRFDKDWNGEVVAEAKADFMPSYLGLHFPASDIPAQARRLYSINYIRQIADVNYAPVPLFPHLNPTIGQSTDMSHSVLRSVSPVHIQYLINMKVQASMSISIVKDGQLWGLIACHHNSPLHVHYRIRMVSEIMGLIFSAQLTTLVNLSEKRAKQQRDKLLEDLALLTDENSTLTQLLSSRGQQLMDSLSSDGLAIKVGQAVIRHGSAPRTNVIQRLADRFKKQNLSLVATEDCASEFADDQELKDLTGGLLAIPISRVGAQYIIWFREAISQQVHWAGDPEKPVEETKAGYRLTPRSSFALWKQQVQSRSKPWSQFNLDSAEHIGRALMECERFFAEKSIQAKKDFFANMSHELRTPMNAIIGVVGILLRDEQLSDEQRELIDMLKISSDSLLELVNDLLDLSKIESSSFRVEAGAFNLSQVVRKALSITQSTAEEKGIELKLKDYPDKQLDFIGDEFRINQILVNLLSNAVKFTEKGHVLVAVKLAALKDNVRWAEVSVSDTGIGMTEEQRLRIFEKFTQADKTIASRFGGTGLGLSITKSLVERMGGYIDVISEKGVGSKFTVRLPLVNDRNAGNLKELNSPTTFPKPPPKIVSNRHILLVEDNSANVLVAKTLLEKCNFDLHIANDGQQAVTLFKNNDYSLVLMDVQMPELDGFQATRQIRQFEEIRGDQSHTPIIGMTAYAFEEDRQKCLDCGMDDFISKPLNIEKFEAMVRYYCLFKNEPSQCE